MNVKKVGLDADIHSEIVKFIRDVAGYSEIKQFVQIAVREKLDREYQVRGRSENWRERADQGARASD